MGGDDVDPRGATADPGRVPGAARRCPPGARAGPAAAMSGAAAEATLGGVASAPPAPRRVLIVSADIGGGHHATGRALEAAVRARWPEATVTWIDTLEVMRAGPAFRALYRANV